MNGDATKRRRHMDSSIPVGDRVGHLLSAMTLEEKIAQEGGL